MLCFDSSYKRLCLWSQQWQSYIPAVNFSRSWKWPSIHVYQKFLLIEVCVCTNAWRNSLASSAAVSFEVCCTNMPWLSSSHLFKIHLYRKSRCKELRNWGLCRNLYRGCLCSLFRVAITFLTEMLQYKLINLIIYILQKNHINFKYNNIKLLIFCIYLINYKSKKTRDSNKFNKYFSALYKKVI